jgi:hypothetical protein
VPAHPPLLPPLHLLQTLVVGPHPPHPHLHLHHQLRRAVLHQLLVVVVVLLLLRQGCHLACGRRVPPSRLDPQSSRLPLVRPGPRQMQVPLLHPMPTLWAVVVAALDHRHLASLVPQVVALIPLPCPHNKVRVCMCGPVCRVCCVRMCVARVRMCAYVCVCVRMCAYVCVCV